jgi:hypothetical protein
MFMTVSPNGRNRLRGGVLHSSPAEELPAKIGQSTPIPTGELLLTPFFRQNSPELRDFAAKVEGAGFPASASQSPPIFPAEL